MDVKLTSHADEVLAALETQAAAGLEACGIQAVSHVQQNIAAAGRVEHGAMKNSFSHLVQGKTCYAGTNNKYAVYHELGTGAFAEGGGGRSGRVDRRNIKSSVCLQGTAAAAPK